MPIMLSPANLIENVQVKDEELITANAIEELSELKRLKMVSKQIV